VEVKLHIFLTPTLDGNELFALISGLIPAPQERSRRTHGTEGPTAVLDAVENGKYLPLPGIEPLFPNRAVRRPVANIKPRFVCRNDRQLLRIFSVMRYEANGRKLAGSAAF
jgi:hypothetical protein